MKHLIVVFLLIIVFCSCNREQPKTALKLWCQMPDSKWEEALPLGNGRLGAMVFGDPTNELLQLNENTIWAGSPN